jgi:anti-sigma factor ChrR (cupin superfamily)
VSDQQPTIACPDSNALAAFCAGTAHTQDRQATTVHVAGCERCRFAIVQLALVENEESLRQHPSAWQRFTASVAKIAAMFG